MVGNDLQKRVKAQKIVHLIQISLTFRYTLKLAEIKDKLEGSDAPLKINSKQLAKDQKLLRKLEKSDKKKKQKMEKALETQ